MLPGQRDNVGACFVLAGPPPAGTPLLGGIAVSPLGQIYTSTSDPTKFVNSYGVLDDGSLCVAPSGVINCLTGGIARTALGAVCTNTAAPVASDPYHDRMRLSAIGELYTTAAVPSLATAFSNGFNSGYD